jgi:biopolymer transport protein ExbD
VAHINIPGGGDRRAVDSEIPLVPFIDLLLCAVMFLLVTAVWNQLGGLAVTSPSDVRRDAVDPPRDEPNVVFVEIGDTGYTVATADGVRVAIPRHGNDDDAEGLRDQLTVQRAQRHDAWVTVVPDDGVYYRDVVAVMDVASGVGFDQIAVSGSN